MPNIRVSRYCFIATVVVCIATGLVAAAVVVLPRRTSAFQFPARQSRERLKPILPTRPSAIPQATAELPSNRKGLDARFIAFSQNAQYYVTALGDKPPAVYETANGRQIQALAVPSHFTAEDGCFSVDGKTVALTNRYSCIVMDASSGAILVEVSEHPQWVIHKTIVQFSPTLNLFAVFSTRAPHHLAGPATDLVIWDGLTGKCIMRRTIENCSCNGFSFSEDGKYILAAFFIYDPPGQHQPGPSPLCVFLPEPPTRVELWRVDGLRKVADVSYTQSNGCWPDAFLNEMGVHGNARFRVRISPSGKPVVLPLVSKYTLRITSRAHLVETATLREVARIPGDGAQFPRLCDGFLGRVFVASTGTTFATLADNNSQGMPNKSLELFCELDILNDYPVPPPPEPKRSPLGWAKLWDRIGSNRMNEALPAFWALWSEPKQTCIFLKIALRTLPPIDSPAFTTLSDMTALLDKLDHPRFSVRAEAQTQLEFLGQKFVPFYCALLDQQEISLEQRRRLEQVVKKINAPDVEPLHLRAIRAIEFLEQLGSLDALDVLHVVANGPPRSWLTQEAAVSIKRLSEARPKSARLAVEASSADRSTARQSKLRPEGPGKELGGK